jgi:hypothetical protein
MGSAVQIMGILVGVGLISIIIYVILRVKQFLRMLLGTSDITKGLKERDLSIAETPKSVSGMTSLMLPKIQEDFPSFNWTEWQHKCENTIREYLESIEQQDTEVLKDASVELKNQAALQIRDDVERKVRQHFDAIDIHQTEITNYAKGEGLCTILIQSSLAYLHTIDGQDPPEIRDRKEQHRFNLELVYVQDLEKVGNYATTYGVTCHNCGAPVSDLGAVCCPYCGQALEPVNIRVWHINKITDR